MKSTPSNSARKEMVVLLHGLNRTHRSMWRFAKAFTAAGYEVVNHSYPSRTMPFEKLASEWLPKLLADHDAESAPRVHFVTHSMGGIVVRLWLREKTAPKNLGRIVMIAPPNNGSEVPDVFRGNPLFHFVTGANGRRLGTDDDSLPRTLSRGAFPSDVELGVIAGNRSLNPLFGYWIEGASDGTVSVASTRLAEMCDHVIMPHSHTGILMRSAVVLQTLHFLENGTFAPL